MKKILILAGLAALAYAPHAFAQGFTALAPIPGLTDPGTTSVVSSDTLAAFFNNLYKYLIGLAATLAVIEIIWGGLEYSTKDSVSKQSDGRERITQAIFGLILVLSPVLVFSIINPSILNLSLSLSPINLGVAPLPPAPAPDTAIPLDGAAYGNGAATPVGQWCFSSMPRTQSYGVQAVPLCWPAESDCAAVLSAAKANPTGYPYSVSDRAQCLQQQ